MIDDFVLCHADNNLPILPKAIKKDKGQPWMLIILKIWMKLAGIHTFSGPFLWLQTFTFPDWKVFNLSLEHRKQIVLLLERTNQ